MKRGIIRIVSGIVLLVMQVLSIIGSSGTNAGDNLGYYIGFYFPAILGVILLALGSHTYQNVVYSELVLHTGRKNISSVVKWSGFTVSTLLSVYYLIDFITNMSDFDIFSLINFFGTLAFSVYTLFYMYKKPSCLFSTTLILVGAVYIYGILSNLSYYILYLSDADFFIPYLIMGILPRFFAGILYIVVAVIMYKEKFSVTSIKVLGWVIFALEILNRVISDSVLMQRLYFGDLGYLLFVVILFLYMSVLKINTMRDDPASVDEKNYYLEHEIEQSFESTSSIEAIGYVLYCRKCGSKRVSDSRFCAKCGTEVIEL